MEDFIKKIRHYEPLLQQSIILMMKTQSISDLADINPPSARNISPEDEVSFIPMAEVTDGGKWIGYQSCKQFKVRNGYTAFEEGDVLFAKITPCMENGKGCHALGLCNGVGYGSTEFHVLRAKKETNPRFLHHLCQSDRLRKKAEAFMIGSAGQQRVQAPFFNYYQLPALNKGEQELIAQILDSIDETIQATEQLLEKLKNMKAGLLNDLLTRGLDENGELRDPVRHPEQFKKHKVGVFPKSWKIGPLGSQISLQRGFDITQAEQRTGNIPVISSSGITSFHDTAMIDGPGVVIGRKGKLGRAYYVEKPFWPHDTTLWVYDFHENIPRFVALFLEFLRLDRFDAATSVPTLNRNFIHPMIVVMPPKDEQEKICDTLAVYEERMVKEEEHFQKLKIIKQGIMDDLLTGKVRVTNLLTDQTD